MSLLDTASLIVTPNGYKEGKLYSVIPSDGSGDMSVVRATTATRVNSAGLVELVPYNLFTYSEQFDNAEWGKNVVTITANATTAPDGTTTADKIIINSGSQDNPVVFEIIDSNTSTRTLSFYAKASEYNIAFARVGGASSAPIVIFSLTGSGSILHNQNALSYSIEPLENGWYRCAMTYAHGTSFATNIGLCSATYSVSATSVTSTGNGTDGIFIWGAQLVEGSTAKDYQKTETRLNIPRLDYSNGTCPSLLVEPQRTNLFTYSEQINNAAWLGDYVAVTANYAVSPSGIQNADRLVGTSTWYYLQDVSLSVGSVYTISCFVKSTSGSNTNFRLFGCNIITSSNQTANNEWQKFSFTFTADSNTSHGISRDSSNNNADLLVWGMQLELGSYATSYIPTTSASVTRNADVISKTSATALIGQTEGTIFGEFEVIPQKNDSMLCLMRDLAGGLYDDFFYIRASSGVPAVSVRQGDVTYVAINGTTALSEGFHKFAFAYKQNDFAFYVDGVQIGTDNSGNVPTCNEIYLGQYADGADREVSKKSFALWKTRLTNTQLAQLTSI
jgi:hypothetical protein